MKSENTKASDNIINSKKVVIGLIIVLTGIGMIIGVKYLFDNNDNNNENDTSTDSGLKYDFSSLEKISLEVEDKKEALPSTLQQLLDFGFVYNDELDEKMLEKSSTLKNEWIKPWLGYNIESVDSYGPLIVKIESTNDEEVSSLNTLITSYEFDWRYLIDNKESKKYDYISLGGIKYGMSIDYIKEYYKDLATDIDNGIRIEKTNVVVNGTDVKRIYLDIYGGENEMTPFVKAMSLNLEF